MKLLDDNLFTEDVDDTEATRELTEEDKDFIKSLEKMAIEAEDEADNAKGVS